MDTKLQKKNSWREVLWCLSSQISTFRSPPSVFQSGPDDTRRKPQRMKPWRGFAVRSLLGSALAQANVDTDIWMCLAASFKMLLLRQNAIDQIESNEIEVKMVAHEVHAHNLRQCCLDTYQLYSIIFYYIITHFDKFRIEYTYGYACISPLQFARSENAVFPLWARKCRRPVHSFCEFEHFLRESQQQAGSASTIPLPSPGISKLHRGPWKHPLIGSSNGRGGDAVIDWLGQGFLEWRIPKWMVYVYSIQWRILKKKGMIWNSSGSCVSVWAKSGFCTSIPSAHLGSTPVCSFNWLLARISGFSQFNHQRNIQQSNSSP